MSTGQAVVLCGQEGNHRSGITMVMHHELCSIFTYGLNGMEKGDEHPAYTPLRSKALFTFKYLTTIKTGTEMVHVKPLRRTLASSA